MTMLGKLWDAVQGDGNASEAREILGERAKTLVAALRSESLLDAPIFVAGSGYDFAEFALPVIEALPGTVLGVACFWTSPSMHPLPDGRRTFNLQWSYIEKEQAKMDNPKFLFCQSVLADELELATQVATMLQTVEAREIYVASAVMRDEILGRVEDEIGEVLNRRPPKLIPVAPEFAGPDLRALRDRVVTTLDEREMRFAPRLTPWLAERGFGRIPKATSKNDDDTGFRI